MGTIWGIRVTVWFHVGVTLVICVFLGATWVLFVAFGFYLRKCGSFRCLPVILVVFGAYGSIGYNLSHQDAIWVLHVNSFCVYRLAYTQVCTCIYAGIMFVIETFIFFPG